MSLHRRRARPLRSGKGWLALDTFMKGTEIFSLYLGWGLDPGLAKYGGLRKLRRRRALIVSHPRLCNHEGGGTMPQPASEVRVARNSINFHHNVVRLLPSPCSSTCPGSPASSALLYPQEPVWDTRGGYGTRKGRCLVALSTLAGLDLGRGQAGPGTCPLVQSHHELISSLS